MFLLINVIASSANGFRAIVDCVIGPEVKLDRCSQCGQVVEKHLSMSKDCSNLLIRRGSNGNVSAESGAKGLVDDDLNAQTAWFKIQNVNDENVSHFEHDQTCLYPLAG